MISYAGTQSLVTGSALLICGIFQDMTVVFSRQVSLLQKEYLPIVKTMMIFALTHLESGGSNIPTLHSQDDSPSYSESNLQQQFKKSSF